LIGISTANIFGDMLKVYYTKTQSVKVWWKQRWLRSWRWYLSIQIYNAQALNKLHSTNICISIGFFLELCGMGSLHQAT